MKKIIILVAFIAITFQGKSQENAFTLSGGYSFANIESTNIKATGWRINGLYEFAPLGGNFANGVAFGYIGISGTDPNVNPSYTSYVNSFPIYYAPKLMFGKEKIKVFVKGAIGLQFAHLKREGIIEVTDTDFGFYGGASAGFMVFVKENIFINAEYEIAWASNSWYNDGWMNTAMAGIGFKF